MSEPKRYYLEEMPNDCEACRYSFMGLNFEDGWELRCGKTLKTVNKCSGNWTHTKPPEDCPLEEVEVLEEKSSTDLTPTMG